MFEKESGSLEKQGSLKCQRSCSSSNSPLRFRDERRGCGGVKLEEDFLAKYGGIISSEVL